MSDTPRLTHKYGTIDKDYAMHLATRTPEEDGPIYMVNLMKYHEVAQYASETGPDQPVSGREADDRYNPSSILGRLGATIVFVGDVVGNHVGAEDWDRIAIVRYATRKSFIDMQSRKDFSEKHVHKAAGMQRTTIVCCRPENPVLDSHGRPHNDDVRNVMMVVRQTADRSAAFAELPQATQLAAEGTIIGDGRKWDTVQFVACTSPDELQTLADTTGRSLGGSAYVMSIRASMDAITQG